jgi:quinol monooxygenase YgiN
MRLRAQLYHQRGEAKMPQGVLAFQYEEEKRASGLTGLAGLPTYLDLVHASGMARSICQRASIRAKGQGWSDAGLIVSLVALNLAGGDCVDDLNVLEADEGLSRMLLRFQFQGMSRKERREEERRWRKERKRGVASPSAMFRYLSAFHDEEQEKKRRPHEAFIPEESAGLRGLWQVHQDFLGFVQRRRPQSSATLDMDATLVETSKEEALWSYKGYKAYQPLNVYWHEQDVVVYSQFRDGNVNCGHRQTEVFRRALEQVPEGVTKVYARTDTQGYEREFLQYLAEGKNERFGVIEFAVGADVTQAFRAAVAEVKEEEWKPLDEGGQQWADVCFVPDWVGRKKPQDSGPTYRFLAIREPLAQPELPGLETKQEELPFPTMEFGVKGRYKLFGVVTNRDLPGAELIRWHRQRCGASEMAHSVMKEDLAGGKLPSRLFGANAAWWAIMLLAYNLNSAMKRLVLGDNWGSKRLKAIRYAIIHLAGRVLERGRQLIVRLAAGHPSKHLLLEARARILELMEPQTG